MRLVLLFLIFLTSISVADPYKNITHYTLDNGLKVYLYPNNKAKNTAITVDVKVGMKAEDEKNAGISHLVEHIVFRDQRIKDIDYVNLFEQEGASFVNGYTKYYKTQYLTTIEAEKSYWITEQFAQMLLDKNITNEDLEIERGALEVEIGELTWIDKYLPNGKNILENLKKLLPPIKDFYESEFGINQEKEKHNYQAKSVYRLNNQKFTLQEVMKHYNDYYYPSNMTLNIVGNFDLKKMNKTIKNSFGKFANRDGKTVLNEHKKIAVLNSKPYKRYDIDTKGSGASIGTKFIANDLKKVIIIDSYIKNLARRLNIEFRSKNGDSYGVLSYLEHHHDGAVAWVDFTAKHDSFDKNIEYAKNLISKEQNGTLSDEIIYKALETVKKEYEAYEHDSSSLMDIVFNYQTFQKKYDDTKTPYELLSTITPDEFRAVLKQTFIPENSYQWITRDYHFFPYDFIFFGLFTIIILAIIHKFFGTHIDSKKIIIHRKLTSKFVSILIILPSIAIVIINIDWIFYFIIKNSPISQLRANGYDTPILYLVYLADFLITIFIVEKLFNWFSSKLVVTDKSLILTGFKSKSIKIDDIKKIEVVPWSPSKFSKIYGMSLLFWKPLVKVVSNQNKLLYLRSTNAEHLKSDLEQAFIKK